jgi:hypothetical protein
MSPTQFRATVAVATTTLGLTVLLAGPMSTFGLGVAGVPDDPTSQVTSTVQTAEQVVTTVETTVQMTRQAVAPLPTAPAPSPAAPPVTKQTIAAPVTKHAATVVRRRTAVTRAAAPTEPAAQVGGASVQPVRVSVGKRAPATDTRPTSTTDRRSTTTSSTGSACDVPVLPLLPGGGQVLAVLAIICSAAGQLAPARIDITPSTDSPAAGALHTIGALRPRRAPIAAFGARSAADGAGRDGAAALTTAVGTAIGTPPVAGRGAGRAYTPTLHATPRSSVLETSADVAARRHHHTFFSGQAQGTLILTAIIIANLSILAGIALWRLAVRFVIPRFA